MSEQEGMQTIEELRLQLHRRMSGRYDPDRMASLVPLSRELDRLVVEATRRQWSRQARGKSAGRRQGRDQADRP